MKNKTEKTILKGAIAMWTWAVWLETPAEQLIHLSIQLFKMAEEFTVDNKFVENEQRTFCLYMGFDFDLITKRLAQASQEFYSKRKDLDRKNLLPKLKN